MTGPPDTAPDAERMLIEAYRPTTPAERLERVVSLNRSLVALSAAGIRLRL